MLNRWIVIGLLALVLASKPGGANVSVAQEAISPALTEQMTTLEQITQALRGLPAKAQVEHKFPTRQETIDYLRSTYDREFPPEEFDKLERFYVALGLLPADIDLQDIYLNLLGSQVAGYYDPDTLTMNVIPTVGDDPGNSLSFTEQIIYVHEFTHALQDQYFDLNRLMEAPEILESPDRSLAVTALVEGDATAVMNLYAQQVTTRNPLAALGLLVEGLQAGNLFLPPGIPPILVNELLFPYNGGMSFVVALYEEGGWDAINAAFANPPTTSEQILHPEKYFAGEGAQEVALDDQSAALGGGWTNVWDSALGEFYLRAHLGTQLSTSAAARAASGWGGDDFRIYQNGDQIAWVLRITWDTPTDQNEFEDAYIEFGDERFGSTAQDGCWLDNTSARCLIVGDVITQIVSAPTLAAAQALAGV